MLQKPTVLDTIVHIVLTIFAFSEGGVLIGILYVIFGYIISYYIAALIGMALGLLMMILAKPFR